MAAKNRMTIDLAGVDSGSRVRRIKIISMGNVGVGKSCLIKRYCEGRVCPSMTFVSKYVSTIGVDYGVKPVNIRGETVKVNFWDLSGHPEFLHVRNEFYRDAQGLLLVFDVTRGDTFAALDAWMTELVENGGPRRLPCVLCGNKVDRARRRVVRREDALAWAAEHRMEYIETSAESGAGVAEAFDTLFAAVVQ